jgi:hypothetical protein
MLCVIQNRIFQSCVCLSYSLYPAVGTLILNISLAITH